MIEHFVKTLTAGKINQNFSLFPDVDILYERTVSVKIPMIRPNISGICPFLQNFHTWKFVETIVFYPISGIFTPKKIIVNVWQGSQ